MINPYSGANPAVCEPNRLIGRKTEFEDFATYVENRRNTVIMGVEGVGKSSFINCFFNHKYQQQMALHKNLLICVTDFPEQLNSDQLYQYLTYGVISALNNLDQPATKEKYTEIRNAWNQIREEICEPVSQFQQVYREFERHGYYITLVVDNFERFVSSPHMTMEHHGFLNSLLGRNLNFIVATNYDFNRSSIPEVVSGSLLLQKFSDNQFKLKGLSEISCAELLRNEDFTSEEIHQLWILSGGIPTLLRKSAEHAWEKKQCGKPLNKSNWKNVEEKVYGSSEQLLARWCKHLTGMHVSIFNEFVCQQTRGPLSFPVQRMNDTAVHLLARGLLANPIDAKSFQLIPDVYELNTPLLYRYCVSGNVCVDKEKANCARQQYSEKLEELIADSSIDAETIINMYQDLAVEHGLPAPISFTSDLTDEDLQEFDIRRTMFDSFSPNVKVFLTYGIKMEQSFRHINMPDFAPSYILFAKAAETHLNATLVPVLKKIVPSFRVQNGGSNIELQQASHLMLGSIGFVLRSRYAAFNITIVDIAAQYCETNGLNVYDRTWWADLNKDFPTIPTLRNDLPHSNNFTKNQGQQFLWILFGGENSIIKRCQNLFDAVSSRGL